MPQSRLSTLSLIVTVLIWGSTYVATKWAMQDAGPFTTAALRFLIGWVILLAPAWRQGFRLRQVLRPDMLKYGLTGTALFYVFQNLGLVFTTPGNAALICAALPAVAAIFSYFLLGERLPKTRLVGVGLSVLGVLLVAGALPAAGGLRIMAGNALILGSIVSWAIYTIQGKRLPPDAPPLVITTASMGAGLLFLLPLAAVEVAVQGLPAFTLPGTLALLYLGCGSSALTAFLWNYAIRNVDASVAAMYPNLIPVVGLVMAAASGEQIGAVQLTGGVLAMAGVWLAEQKAAPAGGRPAA
ncbi:MAG TPA: DMT family transporter [Symbiobacteriaceae bacterium]|nr:DMT family transporter [Symbiobacteriaceae bacterium]